MIRQIRQLMTDTTNVLALGFTWIIAGAMFAMFMLAGDTPATVTAYFTANAVLLFVVGLVTLSKGIAKDSRWYCY